MEPKLTKDRLHRVLGKAKTSVLLPGETKGEVFLSRPVTLFRLTTSCFENSVCLPVWVQGHAAPIRKPAEPGPAGITGNWNRALIKALHRRDTESHLGSVKAWSLQSCPQRYEDGIVLPLASGCDICG